MPVYAYGCKDCGHAFDIHQSFSDSALTKCPECGGVLRKKFNTVGVVFKGSGFYRNDSRAGTGGSTSDSTASAAAPNTTASHGAAGAAAPAKSSTGDSKTGAASGS